MPVKYNFYFTADEVKVIYYSLSSILFDCPVSPDIVYRLEKLLYDHDFADIVASEADDGD